MMMMIIMIMILVDITTTKTSMHHSHWVMATTTLSHSTSPKSPIRPPSLVVERNNHNNQMIHPNIDTVQNFIRRHQHPLDPFRKRLLHQQLSSSSATTTTSPGRQSRALTTTTTPQWRLGTRLTLQCPTPERVIRWYSNCSTNERLQMKTKKKIKKTILSSSSSSSSPTASWMWLGVNHPCAGMTNPTVQYHYYQPPQKHRASVAVTSSSSALHTNKASWSPSKKRADRNNVVPVDVTWWPPVSSLLQHEQQQQPSSSSSSFAKRQKRRQSQSWRLLQYRQTVGYGYDCYQTCRDAILQWEFQHPNSSTTTTTSTRESGRPSHSVTTTHRHSDHQSSPTSCRAFPTITFHRQQGIITIPPPPPIIQPSLPFESEDWSRRRAMKWPQRTKSISLCATSFPTTTTATADTTDTTTTDTTTTTSIQQISWGPGKSMITYTSTPTVSLVCPNHGSNYRPWIDRINRYVLHKLPKFYVINPVTVLYNVVDQYGGGGGSSSGTPGRGHTSNHNDDDDIDDSAIRTRNHSTNSIGTATTYTSTAYGTGYGHWLCGEERITVCYRHPTIWDHPQGRNSSDGDGCVDIEILSYSRPNIHTFMGRIIYPIIRPLQHSFFTSQMKHLQNIANSVPESSDMRAPPTNINSEEK